MRKGPLLLLLSALLLPLYSTEVYQSNMLGQRLNPKTELEGVGWEKTIEDSSEKLYLDGVLYSEKTIYVDGYEIIDGSTVERVFHDEDGRIIRRVISNGDSKEEYNYFYQDGILSSYNYLSPDGTLSTVRYISSDSGKLLSFERDSRSYISNTFYVYELDGSLVRLEHGESGFDRSVNKDEFIVEYLEDGGYREIWGDKEYCYSPDGRLIKEKSPSAEIEYSYSADGTLLSSLTIEGDIKTESYYIDGRVAESAVYKNDVLESHFIYCIDGYVEEYRYIDGVAAYRLLYDRDGKRLMEIEKI